MLTPIPNLEFNEELHLYTVSGINVPSVSKILQPLSMQAYKGIDKDTLNFAAQRGTSVHFSIELYDDTGCEEVREDCQGYFDQYKRWKEVSQPEILATEYRFYHPVLWYAGTVDKIVKIGNRVILLDLKTTAQINHWYLGPQLAAYAFGLGSQDIKVDDVMVLHLTPTDYAFKKVTERLDIFMQCHKIHNFLKEMGIKP
ncbi:MAG: hypothetical protein AWM53_02020 [Candidatus Dichloromethanomonas elyunquensis]|nr:MAG: hypothetical protein AWM53_02020 [Candidatus Dichloromethanomonas elyunquensis]